VYLWLLLEFKSSNPPVFYMVEACFTRSMNLLLVCCISPAIDAPSLGRVVRAVASGWLLDSTMTSLATRLDWTMVPAFLTFMMSFMERVSEVRDSGRMEF